MSDRMRRYEDEAADFTPWLERQTSRHLRERTSFVFRCREITPEFQAFVADVIVPVVELPGKYKAVQKAEILVQVVHNLIVRGLFGWCVADTRDTHRPGVRPRVQVWDTLVKRGFALVRKGSEQSGKVTRYLATGHLLDTYEKATPMRLLTERRLGRNTQVKIPTTAALVVLHTGTTDLATGERLPKALRKQPLPLSPRPLPGSALACLRRVEDTLEYGNTSNLNHTWKAFWPDPVTGKRRTIQPNVCLTQVHSGCLFRGARLYTRGLHSAQALPKRVRQGMEVDGEPVAEWDYQAMAVTMLYHMEGLTPEAGDVYRPEVIFPRFYAADRPDRPKEAVRGFVKRATIICLNARSREAAHSSVGKLLAKHTFSKFLKRVVYKAEGTDPAGIVTRVVAAHPKLSHRFFTAVSAELPSRDGLIMLDILTRFADAGKPVLPLHDGVLCRRSDAEFAERTMMEVYVSFFPRFSPVVKRSY